MADDPDPDYTVAVEEGIRVVASQAAQVSAVRSYAGTVLGVGGVGSVASGVAIGVGCLAGRITGGVALVAFLVVVVCCCLVLWPRTLTPGPDPAILVTWADVPGMTSGRMRKQLALDLSKTYKKNRETVDKMYIWFWSGVIALVVELLAVASAFAVRGCDA
jgi:hypothetical protein